MRSDWASGVQFEHILAAMMPTNRLVMRVCLATGLRVSDALGLRTERLAQRMTVRELKTGKSRRIYLSRELLEQLRISAGKYWVFEHRLNPAEHRTRQAVYKDMKAAARVFSRSGIVEKRQQLSPHSARKAAAVAELERTGDFAAVARLLNHCEGSAVTALYALADKATETKLKRGQRSGRTKTAK